MPIDTDLVQSTMRHTDHDGVYEILNLPDATEDQSPATLNQLNNGLASKQYSLNTGSNISIDNSNPIAPVINVVDVVTTDGIIDGGNF